MTTETTNVDQTTENSVNTSAPNASNEAAKTAERLLEESKKYKERALRAERELEATKKAKLEEQGNWKAIAEESQKKYETLSKAVLEDKLNNAVEREAVKHGCVDVEALLSLGDKKMLQFEQDTGIVHGVELLVEDLKKRKPYLFAQKSNAVINPATPSGVVKHKKLTAQEIAALPPQEKAVYWNKILGTPAAKTLKG